MSGDGGLVCVTAGYGNKLLLELGDSSAGIFLLCDNSNLKFTAAAMKLMEKKEEEEDEKKASSRRELNCCCRIYSRKVRIHAGMACGTMRSDAMRKPKKAILWETIKKLKTPTEFIVG